MPVAPQPADPFHYSADLARTDAAALSRDLLDELQQSAASDGDALAVLDGATVVCCNAAALRLFGGAEEDFVGKAPWEISPPENGAGPAALVSREYVREAYEQGFLRFDWVHQRPDGVRLDLDVSLSRIDLPEGQRLLISFRDITDVLSAQAQLRGRVEFQAFLASVSNALVTAERDGLDDYIDDSLKQIGERYDLDMVRLWWSRRGRKSVFCSHDWTRDGSTVAGYRTDVDRLTWANQEIWEGRGFHFKTLDEYPDEAELTRRYTEGEGIKSLFVTPILLEDEVHGAASYSTITEERDWPKHVLEELELLTRVLGSAWKREEYIQKIRESEAELNRSQQVAKLGTFVETVPPGTTLDEEYGQLRISPEACALFGMEPGNASSKVMESRIHPDDYDDAVRIPRQDGDGNTTRRINYRVIRPDGSEIRVEEWAEIEYNDAGQPIRWFGTVQDVTEQWNARERLRRQNQYQKTLVRMSEAFLSGSNANLDQELRKALQFVCEFYGIHRTAILNLDADAQTVDVVQQWSAEGITGEAARIDVAKVPWSTERMIAGDTFQFASLDDLPERAAADRSFFLSLGISSRFNVPVFVDNKVAGSVSFLMYGEEREWAEEIRDELSLFVRVVITAWHRIEGVRLLKEREAELLRSQQVAHVGSYQEIALPGQTLNEGFGESRLSDEALAIYQIEPGTESVATIESRIHPDDRERFADAFRFLSDEASVGFYDYRVIRPDGSMIYVEDRMQVDRNDNGDIVRVFGTVMDVTNRVESNLQLQTAMQEIKQLKDQLQDENIYLKKEVRSAHRDRRLVGQNVRFESALVAAEKVAPTDVTVLIQGETGTGKELVAREIHQNSMRNDTPLISVNCAALSSELIESELFGHEAGAFTGADQRRKGRFELADGGTLFLDEIGDLPADVQAKILRALQTGEFERLGGMRTLKVDVRLITATNRNLQDMVRAGTFRADLFYRINSFPIIVPALRERQDDIALLANHFVEKHAVRLGKRVRSISPQMIRRMEAMDWPGNVRELEGFIQRALIAADSTVLDYADADDDAGESQVADLDTVQHEYIVNVLERCNWIVGGAKGAATLLGVPPSTLRSRMKKLGIQRPAR